jgi:hypothetical protein
VLAGPHGHSLSYRHSFYLSELDVPTGIVGGNAEGVQSVAALLQCALELCTEAVGGQGVGRDSIEPDGAGVPDLTLERKRLFAKKNSVANGRFALPLREFLKQVR